MYIKVSVAIFIVNSCICAISTPWTRGSESTCYIMLCTMSTECSYAPLRPSPLSADTPTKLVYLLSVALSSLKIALSALSSPFSLSLHTHMHMHPHPPPHVLLPPLHKNIHSHHLGIYWVCLQYAPNGFPGWWERMFLSSEGCLQTHYAWITP